MRATAGPRWRRGPLRAPNLPGPAAPSSAHGLGREVGVRVAAAQARAHRGRPGRRARGRALRAGRVKHSRARQRKAAIEDAVSFVFIFRTVTIRGLEISVQRVVKDNGGVLDDWSLRLLLNEFSDV